MNYIRTLVHNTHATGWHTLLVECNRDGVIENIELQYNHNPTEAELIAAVSNYGEATQYDNVSKAEIDLRRDKKLVVEMLRFIRSNPTITLTQFNNALSNRIWHEQYVGKFFLWKLAVELAAKYDAEIEGLTEAQVFVKVRNWLVANPVKKIAKVIFGEIFEI